MYIYAYALTHTCLCVIYIHIDIHICTLHTFSFYFHTNIQELGKQSVDTHTDTHRHTQTHTRKHTWTAGGNIKHACIHMRTSITRRYVRVQMRERDTHKEREEIYGKKKTSDTNNSNGGLHFAFSRL